MENNIPGIQIDDYFVTFPQKDFIKEDEEGNMFLVVDIYKITADNKREKLPDGELTEEVEAKISAYVNEILLQAIEEEDKAGINK